MNTYLSIGHDAGFFSCSSVSLDRIVGFFNSQKKLPDIVDRTNTYFWYKPQGNQGDISSEYFENYQEKPNIPFTKEVYYYQGLQFADYKELDYEGIQPFIEKYFSPNKQIREIIEFIEKKYELIDYDNLCVLFYRGNDKCTETKLCDYKEYIDKAIFLKEQNPNLKFLIQSDETEFIENMLESFPDAIYFKDEIRHMKKCNNTVDRVFASSNFIFSKYYLAITIIMSRCHTIVCGTGNCSIWIMLYRGNANNIYQIRNNVWL